jgi:hypothetical protein
VPATGSQLHRLQAPYRYASKHTQPVTANHPGAGRGSLTSFASPVIWASVATAQPQHGAESATRAKAMRCQAHSPYTRGVEKPVVVPLSPLQILMLLLLCAPINVRAQEECDIRDINECLSNPCANGATCTESHNDTFPPIPHHAYRCTCLAGFANGTCADTPDWLSQVPEYVGVCEVDTGGNCDLRLNECLRDPCRSECDAHGACACFESDLTASSSAYYCDFVEADDDPCHSSPCANGATCGLASPGDGRYQWLLQCDEGAPVVNFSTSLSHKEIIVYDGDSDRGSELLSCGGYCGGPQLVPRHVALA